MHFRYTLTTRCLLNSRSKAHQKVKRLKTKIKHIVMFVKIVRSSVNTMFVTTITLSAYFKRNFHQHLLLGKSLSLEFEFEHVREERTFVPYSKNKKGAKKRLRNFRYNFASRAVIASSTIIDFYILFSWFSKSE